MPWTEKQRRLFHAGAEDSEVANKHGMDRQTSAGLADEADRLKREGRERRPVRKSTFVDLRSVYGRR